MWKLEPKFVATLIARSVALAYINSWSSTYQFRIYNDHLYTPLLSLRLHQNLVQSTIQYVVSSQHLFFFFFFHPGLSPKLLDALINIYWLIESASFFGIGLQIFKNHFNSAFLDFFFLKQCFPSFCHMPLLITSTSLIGKMSQAIFHYGNHVFIWTSSIYMS